MNIKSVLLGTAAGLMAVTGAQAADLPTAEPAEYVQVCSAFGAGFFYIPGTETCLDIGGYVRFQIGFGDNIGDNDDDDSAAATTDAGDWDFTGRARVTFDARSMTELGLLRSYAVFQSNMDQGAGDNTILDAAFVQLGFVTMGDTGSAGNLGGGFTDSGFAYGPNDVSPLMIKFDHAFGPLAVGFSIEEPASATDFENMPDFGLGIAYSADPFSVKLAGRAYQVDDELALTAGAPVIDGTNDTEFSGGLEVGATLGGVGLKVVGIYDTCANWNQIALNAAQTARPACDGDFYALASASFAATDKITLSATVGYEFAGEDLKAAANVSYTPVANFNILAEVAYEETTTWNAAGTATTQDDKLGGFIRFTRSF